MTGTLAMGGGPAIGGGMLAIGGGMLAMGGIVAIGVIEGRGLSIGPIRPSITLISIPQLAGFPERSLS